MEPGYSVWAGGIFYGYGRVVLGRGWLAGCVVWSSICGNGLFSGEALRGRGRVQGELVGR